MCMVVVFVCGWCVYKNVSICVSGGCVGVCVVGVFVYDFCVLCGCGVFVCGVCVCGVSLCVRGGGCTTFLHILS